MRDTNSKRTKTIALWATIAIVGYLASYVAIRSASHSNASKITSKSIKPTIMLGVSSNRLVSETLADSQRDAFRRAGAFKKAFAPFVWLDTKLTGTQFAEPWWEDESD